MSGTGLPAPGFLLCEDIPEAAADIYARIKRNAERKGTPLDENDLWIAATALALGTVLVRNRLV